MQRYNLNETVLQNGQMWRCLVDGNTNTPPAHPFENTAYWEYVTTQWLHKGTHVGMTEYYRGEVVDLDGSSYYCNTESTLYAPPSSGWLLVAEKGDQGIQGTQGIVWTGGWWALTDYEIDDAVYYGIDGNSYICTQAHLAINHAPNSVDGDEYWDILAQKGDTGEDSTVAGPSGGTVGSGYTYDLLDISGGDDADGNCRFNVIASDLSLATKCWLSNTDNDGNDVGAYTLSFSDTTSAVKCYLTVSQMADNSKFITYTVSSIISNMGGWKELEIEFVSYSSVAPFGVSEEVAVSLSRVGDRGTNWRGGWSQINDYVLADSVSHNSVTWICTEAHTNEEPSIFTSSSYWDVLNDSGFHKGADSIGGYHFDTETSGDVAVGTLWFDDSTVGQSTNMRINNKDAQSTDVSELMTWLRHDSVSSNRVLGRMRVISAKDPNRWLAFEIADISVGGIGDGAYHDFEIKNVTTNGISGTFDEDEEVSVTQTRAGDPAVVLKGTWGLGEEYVVGDVVLYRSSTWICKQDHTDSQPHLLLKWDRFALGINFEGAWENTTDYVLNDIVTYNGSSWISISGGLNTGNTPTVPSFYWEKVAEKGDAGTDGEDGSDADMPIGSIIMWSVNTPPDETWKICDGSSLEKSSYPILSALFDDEGYPYGSSTNNFNLPDMRQNFPAGRQGQMDGGSWAVQLGGDSSPNSTGEVEHRLTESETPEHTHGVLVDFVYREPQQGLFQTWQRFFEFDGVEQGGTDPDTSSELNDHENTRMFRETLSGQYDSAYAERFDDGSSGYSPDYFSSVGSNGLHNNLPPFVVINYIIKVKDSV